MPPTKEVGTVVNDAFRIGVVIGMALGGLLVGLIWLLTVTP